MLTSRQNARAYSIWSSVPLGYDVKDRKLVVNEAETPTVRMIFQRYGELDRADIVSKRREGARGALCSGRSFSRGALYLMLQNRLYRGQFAYKDEIYPGQHEGIVDAETCTSCRTSSKPIRPSARWRWVRSNRACWRAWFSTATAVG